MSGIFHKINENEIFDLMNPNISIENNILIAEVDDISMLKFTNQLSGISDNNFLIDMNSEEIKRIEKIILFILNKYHNQSMSSSDAKLINELFEKKTLLSKSKDEEEINELKYRIDYIYSLLKVSETIRLSQPLMLSSAISDEYIIGKLLESFSSKKQIFNLLNIKNFDAKFEHYKYLINSENEMFPYSLFSKTIEQKENLRFTWLMDGLITFYRLKGNRVVNWVTNFHNVTDPTLQKSVNDIILKSSDIMKFIILTSSSVKDLYRTFKSLDNPFYSLNSTPINGYKNFSLTKNKK